MERVHVPASLWADRRPDRRGDPPGWSGARPKTHRITDRDHQPLNLGQVAMTR